MTIEQLIIRGKYIYDHLLDYIENEMDDIDQSLIDALDEQNILNDREELRDFLNMISKITIYHNRSANFLDKIKKIFFFIKKELKTHFTQIELYRFFKYDKFILLFLFDNNFLIPTPDICQCLLDHPMGQNFYLFFYPEIKTTAEAEVKSQIYDKLLQIDSQIFDYFEEKRHIGVNDSYLCSLIQNDSIVEFVSYINKTNFSLSSQIRRSIFETNAFLINKEPTLIEYAAFYGSMQILNYLRLNNVELTPSLWIYGIHSNNPELIHLLEENHIEPADETYEQCMKEAIKCHHNNIANYIQNNLLKNEEINIHKTIYHILQIFKVFVKLHEKSYINKKYYYDSFIKNDEYISEHFLNKVEQIYGVIYHNYEFLENILFDQITLCILCEYDYFLLVKLLLKSKKLDINFTIVLKYFILIKFYIFIVNTDLIFNHYF